MNKRWNKYDRKDIGMLLDVLDKYKNKEDFIKELQKSKTHEFLMIKPCFGQDLMNIGIDDEIECIKLTLKASKVKVPYYKICEENSNKGDE